MRSSQDLVKAATDIQRIARGRKTRAGMKEKAQKAQECQPEGAEGKWGYLCV